MEISELKNLIAQELVYYRTKLDSTLDNGEVERAGRIYQRIKALNWVLDICEGKK